MGPLGDDRRAAVLVTAWMHGGKLVGRVTRVPDDGQPTELGPAYPSADEICAAVRTFLDNFASSGPS